MTKPTKAHLTTAQRIYDRLGRGSVADIDAIAQALAEAERGGLEKGYLGGFASSAEGYNAEYPFDDDSPLNSARWVECRDMFVAAVLSEAES